MIVPESVKKDWDVVSEPYLIQIDKLKEELQTTKEELQSEKNKVASLVNRVGDLENNVETLGKLLKEERDRFQVYVTRYSYQMMQTFKQEMEVHITSACVRISNIITHPPEYYE